MNTTMNGTKTTKQRSKRTPVVGETPIQLSIFSQPECRNRVNLRPRPGEGEAQAMTVGSGERLLRLYGRFGPHGASLKTCVASLVLKGGWFSTRCYLNWKPLVMKSGRFCFQLAPKTPRTDGIGSGLWPTMRSRLTGDITPARTKDKFNNLESVLARQMWPTPKRPSGGGQIERKTPGGGIRKLEDKVSQVEGYNTGQLNPVWVTRLMGYPDGWLELGEQENGKKASQGLPQESRIE